jgi:phosphatidylglycerol:prolipoprotein diacylglycerol transferase
MHPILFHLGDYPIHSYGFLGGLGFLLVATMALIRGRALGLVPDRLADLMIGTGFSALVGARALFLWQNPEAWQGPYSLVDLRSGGLVFYGGLLTGLPVAAVLLRRFGLPAFATWDLFATGLPLGHALTRVGCHLAGCCWGAPTDLPWAVRYSDPLAAAPLGQALHPVQLLEAGWLLALGLACNLRYPHRRWDGEVTLWWLGGYAAGRFALESLRGDEARGLFLPQWLGDTLSFSQGVSLLLGAGAVAVFGVLARRLHRA